MISRDASNRKNASNMPAIAGTPSTAVTKATEVAPKTRQHDHLQQQEQQLASANRKKLTETVRR
jgi:hypothetical protein